MLGVWDTEAQGALHPPPAPARAVEASPNRLDSPAFRRRDQRQAAGTLHPSLPCPRLLGPVRCSSYNGVMTTVPCFHVDAFASAPFTGNPAAVCLLTAPRPAKWMQNVAAEMNLSETAFVTPRRSGFALRWFTPEVEVELCGHATLATAHVLWSEGLAPAKAVLRFATKGGLLTAARRGERIELDFPARPARIAKGPAALAEVLGQRPVAVARAADDLLVELASEQAVRKLQPDLAALGKLKVRGVIVTAAATGRRHDFVSRFFAPAVGVPEDPVTGSAHCALAPWWSKKLGKQVLRGHQVSTRGGEVEVEVVGDRVLLRGTAVTVVRGELVVSRDG